jgi:hypothetical protein
VCVCVHARARDQESDYSVRNGALLARSASLVKMRTETPTAIAFIGVAVATHWRHGMSPT